MSTTVQQQVSRPAQGAAFPVRRMDYDFDDMPRYWCDNDPGLTHYFTGLSLLFPEGESYFVRAVRALRQQVRDPQLQQDIGRFIGQEAMHSKEHHALHVSARQFGLDPDSLEAFTGRVLKLIEKRASKRFNLLVTVGLEHYTAVKVVNMMRSVNTRMTDDTIRSLWLWHSVEETEHKAVAFDMYQHLYGNGVSSYLNRVGVYSFSLAMILALSTAYTVVLMRRDGQLLNGRSWRHMMSVAAKEYGSMLPRFLRYYRPGFHPDELDEGALVEQVKARLGIH